MDQSSDDFMVKYRNISSKLKKRFLRKPNVAEASEDFGHLARNLSEGEAWAQAGLCCVVVARCEQTLVNSTTEVAALTQAARYFLKAEFSNNDLHCPNFKEHLITAVSCYQHAMQLYLDMKKPALAGSLGIELGRALKDLGQFSEALTHLNSAAELFVNSPLDHLMCLKYIASCKIDLGDLDGALTVYTQMTDIAKRYGGDPIIGAYKDILSSCEIFSLLILLTLQPLPQQMKTMHLQLLDKYSWTSPDSENIDVPYEDKELAVLLQSLVLACQGRDLDALSLLGQHLTALLTPEHLHLLHILLTEMSRS